MEFRLIYEGPLKSKANIEEKHALRKYFHPQLKELWNQPPLSGNKPYLNETPKPGEISIIEKVENFNFAPFVTNRLQLIAELDIVMLRAEEPGNLFFGGDIDNSLKILFDALRMPHSLKEIPLMDKKTETNYDPLYCLLQDDKLVTSVKVTIDRFLHPKSVNDIFLVIHVKLKGVKVIWGNIGIID